MVLQVTAAAAAPSSPTVCALEPRATAQSRHHLVSPHHPISRADALELRDATHHLWSSPSRRRSASRGAEPPDPAAYADARGRGPRGRRRGRAVCTLVRAPRSRCWAFLGLWRLMVAAEGWRSSSPQRLVLRAVRTRLVIFKSGAPALLPSRSIAAPAPKVDSTSTGYDHSKRTSAGLAAMAQDGRQKSALGQHAAPRR